MASWHWRNTMRAPRFFGLDARAAFPFLVLLLHIRLWTIVLATLITLGFYLMERRGLTYEAGIRAIRSYVIGKKRSAVTAYTRRRLQDRGY